MKKATEKDIGHLCWFIKYGDCEPGWNDEKYEVLSFIDDTSPDRTYVARDGFSYEECYPLSKAEVENLTGFNVVEDIYDPDFIKNPKKYIKIDEYKSALQKADGLRLRLDETITALRLIAANCDSRPEWSKQRFSLTLGNVRRMAEGMLERLGQWY